MPKKFSVFLLKIKKPYDRTAYYLVKDKTEKY